MQELEILDRQAPESASEGGLQRELVDCHRRIRRGTQGLKVDHEDIERIARHPEFEPRERAQLGRAEDLWLEIRDPLLLTEFEPLPIHIAGSAKPRFGEMSCAFDVSAPNVHIIVTPFELPGSLPARAVSGPTKKRRR